MSPSFRFAAPEELPEVARLVTHSFASSTRTAEQRAEELRRTPYGDGPEILWVGEEDGRLVAACQLHRLGEWVTGERIPTMGLGTVVIAPTHRQRGLASRMVEGALQAARERGDVASALFPFRVSFYRKLGYGLAGEAVQYRLPPDALPPSEERRRVELAESPAVRREVSALYERWIRAQTGQVSRTEGVWEQLLATPDRALVAYRGSSGALEGYARVVYRVDLPPPERFLEVEELVWTSTPARRGLYGWLSSLGDQWPEILLRSLPEQRLGDWIREPRMAWGSAPPWALWFPSATLMRGPMFRLVDLAGAWSRRGVAADARLTLALDVQDDQLGGNAGRWRLRLEGGRVAVERGEGTSDLSLGLRIDTLSRIFVGALPPSAAVEAELASVDRPERLADLDHALRVPQPWTWDRF